MALDVSDPRLFEAMKALKENAKLIPEQHKILRNANFAMLAICQSINDLQRSVDLLHNKLQPVLKELSDDQDIVRNLTRRSD